MEATLARCPFVVPSSSTSSTAAASDLRPRHRCCVSSARSHARTVIPRAVGAMSKSMPGATGLGMPGLHNTEGISVGIVQAADFMVLLLDSDQRLKNEQAPGNVVAGGPGKKGRRA